MLQDDWYEETWCGSLFASDIIPGATVHVLYSKQAGRADTTRRDLQRTGGGSYLAGGPIGLCGVVPSVNRGARMVQSNLQLQSR